jgi:hypothetical protein
LYFKKVFADNELSVLTGKTEALQRLAVLKDPVPRIQVPAQSPPSSGVHHSGSGTGPGTHPKHYPGHPKLVGSSSLSGRNCTSESESSSEAARIQKFHSVLHGNTSSTINMEELKKLSWSGVPGEFKP